MLVPPRKTVIFHKVNLSTPRTELVCIFFLICNSSSLVAVSSWRGQETRRTTTSRCSAYSWFTSFVARREIAKSRYVLRGASPDSNAYYFNFQNGKRIEQFTHRPGNRRGRRGCFASHILHYFVGRPSLSFR